MSTPSSLLSELGRISVRAGQIAQESRSALARELKGDGSIVTNADRAVEEYLRKELPALVPGSTVWGEEFGHEPEGPGGLWVVDPVDGTSNFAFGSPLWGVSIGLVQGDSVVLGSINLADLGELYIAEKGTGAWRNDQPLPPLPTGPIRREELVSYCDGVLTKYGKAALPGKMRCTGAFVIEGAFVACQRYRGMIGDSENLYDAAAAVLINQELGAEVRYADGRPFDIAAQAQGRRIAGTWIIFPPDTGFSLKG